MILSKAQLLERLDDFMNKGAPRSHFQQLVIDLRASDTRLWTDGGPPQPTRSRTDTRTTTRSQQ